MNNDKIYVVDTSNPEAIKGLAQAIAQAKEMDISSTDVERQELTHTEAAKFLELSKVTIVKYRNAGLIPYRKVGRRIFYYLDDLEKVDTKSYKKLKTDKK